jgi:hypothetical protein
MKNRIKIKLTVVILTITVVIFASTIGCKTPETITGKTGEQLWTENCTRCHNAPDPRTFSDDQWDAGMEHMRQTALLTDKEVSKIRNFLKTNK